MGMSPAEFWSLTPYLFSQYMQGYRIRLEREHKENCWLMWHNVAWARCKRLPKLTDVLGIEKKASIQIDQNAIIARLKAYNSRLEQEGVKNG